MSTVVYLERIGTMTLIGRNMINPLMPTGNVSYYLTNKPG